MKLGFAAAVKEHGDHWRDRCGQLYRMGMTECAKAVLSSSDPISDDRRDYVRMKDWMPGGFNRKYFSR